MNTKQVEQLVEMLYPYFLKKLKEDGLFKNNVRMKNAIVVSELPSGGSNINQDVEVRLPYDSTSFFVPNKTGENLNKENLICLMYWIDLKNAVAMFKVG